MKYIYKFVSSIWFVCVQGVSEEELLRQQQELFAKAREQQAQV